MTSSSSEGQESGQRLGPQKGKYPTVLLGDGRWERVIDALDARGTVVDRKLARYIDEQVQEVRRGR